MSKILTREQELLKMKTLDIISDITSVRNPHRIIDMERLVQTFGPISQVISKKHERAS